MQIYKITNLINGKIYIGKEVRAKQSYFGSGKIIKLAIIKYGKTNFSKIILEKCDNKEILKEREIYWINIYDSTNKKIGYNITKGGDGGGQIGRKLSIDHKNKIRLANLGRKDNYKRRKKISNALKGKVKSLDTKINISTSLKTSLKYKESRLKFVGLKHTEEHKINISKSVSGVKNGFYGKEHNNNTKEKMKNSKLIKVPIEVINQIIELRKNKLTYKQIANSVNYGISIIIRILKNN